MKPRLIYLVVTLTLLAAWVGKFVPGSWPDGYH
jgi:hypothetical protein